ncbi:MAG: sulfotransferase family protein [Paracoccus sp. (in: a-proteobacteria)]
MPTNSNALLVNFMIVGVQKAGTTALHHFLSRHPDIFMPAKKELHFFNQDRETDWSAPDYAPYHQHFADASGYPLRGEATPAYCFMPQAAARIHAYNPAARIILMLRDPVSRAHSQWRMEVTRGKEDLSFSQAIREGRQREGYSRLHHSYVERGFYLGQIQRLHGLFGQDQCLILLNDDLRDDLQGVLDRCWRFLGCDAGLAPCLANSMIRPMESDPELAPISAEDAAYLRRIYAADIAATARAIDRDLAHWL